MYTYCHNDPINFTDPSGHVISKLFGGLGGAIAKTVAKVTSSKDTSVSTLIGKATSNIINTVKSISSSTSNGSSRTETSQVPSTSNQTGLGILTGLLGVVSSFSGRTSNSSAPGKENWRETISSGGILTGIFNSSYDLKSTYENNGKMNEINSLKDKVIGDFFATIEGNKNDKKKNPRDEILNRIKDKEPQYGKLPFINGKEKDSVMKLPFINGKEKDNVIKFLRTDDDVEKAKTEYMQKYGEFLVKEQVKKNEKSKDEEKDKYEETSNSDIIDLSELKPEDVTRAIAEYLIANPVAVYATQHGWLKDLFWAAGFFRDDKGVYHARQDALQQYGGYNFVYDIVFDYATSMKVNSFEFTYNGQDYRFWAWKGDYLNLGAGAELGLYKRLSIFDNQTDHWLVDTDIALPMTLTLKDNKGNLIASYNPSEPQWWIIAFNPYKQDVNAGDLRVTYTIDFSGNKEKQGMFDAFYKQWNGQDSRWTFDEKNYKATLEF